MKTISRNEARQGRKGGTVRIDLDRPLLDALDAYASDQFDKPDRGEAARRILSSWLCEAGYLAKFPADEGKRPHQLNASNDD